MATPSALKATVPKEGVAVAGETALIVAVNVTAWFQVALGWFETTALVVAALLTFWVVTPDVLAANLPLAVYAAVRLCAPTVSALVKQVAIPLVSA